MATIKTTGSGDQLRIITKTVDGEVRVSCECCEICCMYPAASAVAADLPDAITLLGVGSLAKSGTDYGNTTNGVIFESGVWALYTDGNRSTSNCLIRGDGKFTPGNDLVEDQFAAVYYWDHDSITETFTRDSLCNWTGDYSGFVPGYYNALIYVADRSFVGLTGPGFVLLAANGPATIYYLSGDQIAPNGGGGSANYHQMFGGTSRATVYA